MKVFYGLDELPHGCPRPVATIGNFDGVHLGHQQLMLDLVKRSEKIAGTPTVVTFHPHPLQVLAPYNAPRQIQTLSQKLITVEMLGIQMVIVIPFTLEFAQTSARDFATRILWDQMKLQEIYVGPNFAFGHRREGSFNLLKEIGEEKGFAVGKIRQVQFRGSRVSSTAVRQALLAGQVALARRLLGRPYALEGEIVHGTATGAGIAFPTANLKSPNELIPRNGVYVTLLIVDGRRHPAVTNIGVRPTVMTAAGGAAVTIETYVLDFSQNLYGRNVTVEFLLRLREERKFSGKDALAIQIRKDTLKARRYFGWLKRAAPALLADSVPKTLTVS
jgi:riboflavin kinase / FMN adenylyltransferase